MISLKNISRISSKLYKLSSQSFYKLRISNQFQSHLTYPNHQSFLRYSFSTNNNHNKIESILQQPDNYESDILLQEYKIYIEQLDNYDKSMEISNKCLKQLKKNKDDYQKALEICNLAINLCEEKYKKQYENPHIFFKGQQILLNNKLGNINKSNELVEQIYNEFNKLDNIFNVQYQIISGKYILEIMTQINNISYSKLLLNDLQNLLAQDNWQCLNPNQIYDIYYLSLGISFLDNNYDEAIIYGWKCYQQLNKLNQSFVKPQYILIAIYLCHKELSQFDKLNEIKNEINSYEQFNQDFFEKLQNNYFQPFNWDTQDELNKKIKKNNNNNNNEQEKKQNNNNNNEQQQNRFIYDKKNDKGNEYIKNKEYNKGIQYYSEILNELNQTQKDNQILLKVFIQDRIGYIYGEMQEYKKSQDLLLKSHDMLLKLYNNELKKNEETFQNLTYLKQIYEKQNNQQKSLEYGEKWHNYCMKYKLYDIESQVLESNMLTYADNLIKSGKDKQLILEYTQIILQYLHKFNNNYNNNKNLFKYGFYQILYTFSVEYHNIIAQKDSAISLCEISKQLSQQYPEYKQHYYNNLKESALLTIETEYYNNFMRYGQEYLNVRNEFESDNENDNLNNIIKIMFNLGQQYCNQNDFESAEKILLNAIELSKRNPTNEQYIQIQLLLCAIFMKDNKLDQAEQYYQQSLNCLNNLIHVSDNILKEINQISCILNYHQGNYDIALDFIEKLFQKSLNNDNNNNNNLDIDNHDIIIILLNLFETQEYQKRVQDIISKYNISIEN